MKLPYVGVELEIHGHEEAVYTLCYDNVYNLVDFRSIHFLPEFWHTQLKGDELVSHPRGLSCPLR